MTELRLRADCGLFAFVFAAVYVLQGAGGLGAQTLNFGAGGSDQPIEIHADDGIEWQQENLLFLARGNARAVRGDVTVFGDELRAYYREKAEGGSEIHRLDAIGHVRIVSATQEGSADQAIYDVDNAVLILSGAKPRFRSGSDEIVAERQIEYWEQKQMAVARGNAAATRADRTLRAETLAAYFRKDADGKNNVFRVDAFDRVLIRTATETATGDRGVYNVESGIATLTGSVKVERENNVLTGCRTEVNMMTNISKMFACPKDRVRGTLSPSEARKTQPPKPQK
ncbi:MAG: LptA/OstA family protein, partial [Pseudomonadota bacterium]